MSISNVTQTAKRRIFLSVGGAVDLPCAVVHIGAVCGSWGFLNQKEIEVYRLVFVYEGFHFCPRFYDVQLQNTETARAYWKDQELRGFSVPPISSALLLIAA